MRVIRPQFAVLIPHPDRNALQYVVRTENYGIPAYYEPEHEQPKMTREATARAMMSHAALKAAASVDRVYVSPAGQTLYTMKPPQSAELRDGYEWINCDPSVWSAYYEEIAELRRPESHQYDRLKAHAIEKLAMQACALHTLTEALGTVDEGRVLQSFFFENSTMYGLDSTISL
ncbi:MAG TPA: hypothetical protein PL191_02185 [Candidatus Saccharimonas sp.]|nr:hypothetical protein [Candidatus Saccharimonas sp.]